MTQHPLPDTPAVLVDVAKAEANLARAQAHADKHGFALRPHIKTHKLPYFAKKAEELGAIGINCQKIGEAEVMADAGLRDILITYNIIGERKLARLRALHDRITLAVVADSAATIEGYAGAFTDSAHPLRVFVECETGAQRCGVQTPDEAVALARQIAAAPGLYFAGIMTYPPKGDPAAPEALLAELARALGEAGLAPPTITSGGTPSLYSGPHAPTVTEYRPGTYIYSDRMQVGFGHGTLEDCALSVLATVVSRPTGRRAVIDAGSKALAADTCAAPGHGHIVEYPDAIITSLSEEHGVIDLGQDSETPRVGELVRVIPNHVCIISNLFDEVWFLRDGQAPEAMPIEARGKVR
ncbi:D-TA family PLP-dependent enzyme [Oceaniglobus trochenteri]|uniref:D-TA family PLP-dependent enzyme n=1 Tax=Oceaniglobus trochenteri TaxID=2763260 RepID=UPI001CFFA615|nr:D-TA family PLP-dependent enzyme [Oceaniglobus trochenteri]